MKKILLFLSFISLNVLTDAQTFKIDTLKVSGSNDNRINIVFMGDGYTSTQQTQFVNDAKSLMTKLFAQTPFKQYKNYFNVYAIEVISNESGAKHPGTAFDEDPNHPISNPDNYFGSTFDNNNTHRALVLGDYALAATVLTEHVPDYDQGFMLVNTPYYGGTGGSVATSSLHAQAGEIVIHEMGHSFGKLSDEYWAGTVFARETPNMTATSDTNTVKWKRWLGYNGRIDVFEHDNGGNGWYKPSQGTCKMELLGPAFCAVCTEQTVTRTLNLVNSIDAYTPEDTTFTVQADQKFTLKLVKPIPNTLNSNWLLNGNNIGHNIDSITVAKTSFKNGNNKLVATVLDTTALIRASNHKTQHLHTVNWYINNVSTGISYTSTSSDIVLSCYPSPANTQLNISIKANNDKAGSIYIFDMNGKAVWNKTVNAKDPNSFIIDTQAFANGLYSVIYRSGDIKMSQTISIAH